MWNSFTGKQIAVDLSELKQYALFPGQVWTDSPAPIPSDTFRYCLKKKLKTIQLWNSNKSPCGVGILARFSVNIVSTVNLKAKFFIIF